MAMDIVIEKAKVSDAAGLLSHLKTIGGEAKCTVDEVKAN